MIALHLGLIALLLQTDVLQRVLPQVVPVSISLLDAPALRPAPQAAPPLPAPARTAAPVLPWLPLPELAVRPAPSPEPVDVADASSGSAPPFPAPPAAPTPPTPTTATTRALAAPTVPARTPPPAEPRPLPPGAISYRVPPAIAVPLASRRPRESGTVWLRVRVDREGLPVRVTVHESSGFPRLDEQALGAMQAARFEPQTENGTAIEWVVIAPLAYDID